MSTETANKEVKVAGGFRLVSTEEFAQIEIARLVGAKYIASEVSRIGAFINNANSMAFLPVLAERTKSETVRIMSDVWAQEFYREVLVFDHRSDKGANRSVGLKWVKDGASLDAGCNSDMNRYAFLEVKPVSDQEWERINNWIDTEAGIPEGDKAAADRILKLTHEAAQIVKGSKVVVARGRKVAKGTTGVVIGTSSATYGNRVGIATSDRKDGWRHLDVVWVDEKNVDVVQDPAVEKQICEEAEATRISVVERIRSEWKKTLSDFHVGNPVAARALVS